MEMLYVVLFSALFAVSMKLAHETGEGKFNFFIGSGVVFGLLMGLFSSMVIVNDYHLANIWMAALAGWILRSKISHFYVAIGATTMFLSFLLTNNEKFIFEQGMFLLFFGVMAVSGLLHDFLHERGIMDRKKSELMHSIIFYTILPLYYSVYSGNWLVFGSFFAFMLSYELTRNMLYTMDNKKPALRSKGISKKRTSRVRI